MSIKEPPHDGPLSLAETEAIRTERQVHTPPTIEAPKQEVPLIFVTFGQIHAHRVNGRTFDADVVAAVRGDRKEVFELFGDQFMTTYDEVHIRDPGENVMQYYSRGILAVDSKDDFYINTMNEALRPNHAQLVLILKSEHDYEMMGEMMVRALSEELGNKVMLNPQQKKGFAARFLTLYHG